MTAPANGRGNIHRNDKALKGRNTITVPSVTFIFISSCDALSGLDMISFPDPGRWPGLSCYAPSGQSLIWLLFEMSSSATMSLLMPKSPNFRILSQPFPFSPTAHSRLKLSVIGL
jgi:hypothetical protein